MRKRRRNNGNNPSTSLTTENVCPDNPPSGRSPVNRVTTFRLDLTKNDNTPDPTTFLVSTWTGTISVCTSAMPILESHVVLFVNIQNDNPSRVESRWNRSPTRRNTKVVVTTTMVNTTCHYPNRFKPIVLTGNSLPTKHPTNQYSITCWLLSLSSTCLSCPTTKGVRWTIVVLVHFISNPNQ